MKDMLFIIIGCALVGTCMFISWNRKRKIRNAQIDAWLAEIKRSMLESADETKKLRSGEIPPDTEILMYYKMHLKKLEIEARNTWSAEEPISFEEWEKNAKTEDGWRYIIGMTSDAFVGIPVTEFQRFHDYRAMVKEDEKLKEN